MGGDDRVSLVLFSLHIVNVFILLDCQFFTDQDCVSGSLGMPALATKGRLLHTPPLLARPAVEHYGEQRIYPNIKFGCNGRIVGISFAALLVDSPTKNKKPEVQVWRKTDLSLYANVLTVSLAPADRTSSLNVYQLHLDEPVTFMRGDVIGLYLPGRGSSRFAIQFWPGGTIANFSLNFSQSTSGNVIDLSNTELMQDHDIPMVIIESG